MRSLDLKVENNHNKKTPPISDARKGGVFNIV